MGRRTSEEWRLLVEEWGASGQGCKEWAEPRGIAFAALGYWRWKLGLADRQQAESTTFVDVVVRQPEVQRVPPDLVVEFGALRVRVPAGFDAGELRRVVDALC